jgi:hypothetical protein
MKINESNNQKLLIISTFTASMIGGMSPFGMTSSVFAQGGEIPIVGGLCPEGHECICTPAIFEPDTLH